MSLTATSERTTMELLVVMTNTDTHVCKPPTRWGTRMARKDETRYGLNSVAVCSCGRRWVLRAFDRESFIWTPLRWYHFAARKALKGLPA